MQILLLCTCTLAIGAVSTSGVGAQTSESCTIADLASNNTLENAARKCLNTFDEWVWDNMNFGRNWNLWGGDGEPMRKRRQAIGVGVTRASDDRFRLQDFGNWSQICELMEQTATCIDNTTDCGLGIDQAHHIIRNRHLLVGGSHAGQHYENMFLPVASFQYRVCTTGKVNSSIQTLIDSSSLDTSCLNENQTKEIEACAESLQNEFTNYMYDQNFSDPDTMKYWNRLAMDSLICARQILLQSTCNEVTKKLFMTIGRVMLPEIIDISKLQFRDLPSYDYRATKRCTVGVYGDPHLRVCFDSHLQTCAAKGHQVYLSHSVVRITGVNVEIQGRNNKVSNPKPTNMQEVVVTFHSIDGTTILGTYTAKVGDLPDQFDEGGTTLGSGTSSVSLTGTYRKTFIQASIGLIMVLRRWRKNYFFTLRTAENAIEQSSGLLAKGCPQSELLDRGRWVGMPRRKRQASDQAIDVCSTLAGEFNDICQYDVTYTGLVEYANMTIEAVDDIADVVKQDKELRENAISPNSGKPNGCSQVDISVLFFLSFMLFVLILQRI